jgi:hypothetical protein
MVTRPKREKGDYAATAMRQNKSGQDTEHLVRAGDFSSRQESATTAMPQRIAEER